MEKKERQSGEAPRTMPPALFVLILGVCGGVIWGLARWLAVALSFTKVPQAFLADPWIKRASLNTFGWHLAGLGMFVLMTIVAAFVYWLLLGKLAGPWPGFWFGLAWWALLFGIGPATGAIPPLRTIGWNSIFSELCLYVVWGLFIGYSYAFEFHDESAREPAKADSGEQPQPAS
ncbi:YqhR family membrane protein [Cohnella sp. REN36]|uniref:YqhR family membrane protein n=1 Tax=Cohnella sp. REN36 TaxID=2887347 RepID=UPI001D15D023|nr:YqhR family membrane protein [Cohnella sp. REN36]MCC3373374.1 YqhR family membrane protein [Cohnella sp. REN36]